MELGLTYFSIFFGLVYNNHKYKLLNWTQCFYCPLFAYKIKLTLNRVMTSVYNGKLYYVFHSCAVVL